MNLAAADLESLRRNERVPWAIAARDAEIHSKHRHADCLRSVGDPLDLLATSVSWM